MHLPHQHWLSIGLSLLVLAACSPLCNCLEAQSLTIDWEVQFNTTSGNAYFQGVSMCKGTTQGTRKVGFIASYRSIWRTLDGEQWEQVNQLGFAEWNGVFCFPDAQRVIAVGQSTGDDVGPIFTWSFDGGKTWDGPNHINTQFGAQPVIQGVHFYNDTHGVILPSTQNTVAQAYYTTTGGKRSSDWIPAQDVEQLFDWIQSHPVWAFGDVSKTLSHSNQPEFCWSENAGMKWYCVSAAPVVGSWVDPDHAVGIDLGLNVYSTTNGGFYWKLVSSLPADLQRSMMVPSDMVWIPNSDVVILVGGSNSTGTVAHSLDRGTTWKASIPGLPTMSFNSVDILVLSETTTEVWAVGGDGRSAVVLHATVSVSGAPQLSEQW